MTQSHFALGRDTAFKSKTQLSRWNHLNTIVVVVVILGLGGFFTLGGLLLRHAQLWEKIRKGKRVVWWGSRRWMRESFV